MIQQRTKQWYEERKGRVTASAVGAILGVDPWTTRDDVMRRMVREWHNAPLERGDNPAMAWGRANEEIAKQAYMMRHGQKLKPCGFYTYYDFELGFNWLGASPDARLLPDRVFECKTPYHLRNAEPPVVFKSIFEHDLLHYYAQVQTQMFVCNGANGTPPPAVFYQWAPKGDKVEEVPFNADWWWPVFQILKNFYQEYLYEREEPYCQKYLEDKWAYADDVEITVLLSAYDSAVEKIKENEALRKALLEKIVDYVGSRNTQFADGRKLTLCSRTDTKYAQAVKDMLPGIDLSQYQSRSQYWKL